MDKLASGGNSVGIGLMGVVTINILELFLGIILKKELIVSIRGLI
jgi:hypothetical protein